MEWLQIYKIGKELIESGQKEKVDAFLVNYQTPKIKGGSELKNAYVLEVILDIKTARISLELKKDYEEKNINIDNVFQTISGRTTNYVLSPTYGKDGNNVEHILNFFKKSFLDNYKKLIEINLKKDVSQKIKKEKIQKGVKASKLIEIREKITKSQLFKNLEYLLKNIKKIIEIGKEKDILKTEQELIKKQIKPLPKSSRLYLSGEKAVDFVPYVRLKIIDKDGSLYLNRHPEYRKYIMDRYLLEFANLNEKVKEEEARCYLSGKQEAFPVRFPRDFTNILRISTDTNTVFRSFFSGKNKKGDRFLLSRSAYLSLKIGANYLNYNHKVRIAGLPHYVIPDFIKDFNLTKFRNDLKNNIDLAFQSSQYKNTRRQLERISSKGLNSITFIGYEASEKEKSIDIRNRIQSVNPDRYNQVVDLLNSKSDFLSETRSYKNFNKYTFGTLYTIIPEKKKTTNTLSLFKSLLENYPIKKELLFSYYSHLIHLYWYGTPDGKKEYYNGTNNIRVFSKGDKTKRDFAICIATLRYLILINVIDELYDKKITNNMETNSITENPKSATLFEEFNFNSSYSKLAMFYLGKLLRNVAEAQSGQKHYHKPILKRVSFNGMDVSEIKNFRNELLEKMVQYNKSQKSFYYGEDDLKHFDYYFCKAESKWDLTETENVFYLFTGYSMFWEVKEPREKENMKDAGYIPEDETEESNSNQ